MTDYECISDSSCCYQDDSGAESLKRLCMGLAAALIVTTLGLFWAAVAWKMGWLCGKVAKDTSAAAAQQGLAEQGAVEPNNSGELTTSGSPASNDVDITLKKKASHLSLRSLRSFGSLSGLNHVESIGKGVEEPPSPCSTVTPDDVLRLRVLLDTERSRRMAAEQVLGRRASTPTSLGTPSARLSLRKFPGPRAIDSHTLEATANAARWVQSAATRAGATEPELPSLVKGVLVHLFETCRAEVKKRLEVRVDGLRTFVGGSEPVQLGGGVEGMAGDTQELLYGELRRRFQGIAAVGRKELVSLAAGVLSRGLETEAQRDLGRKLVHQTWPSFEPLVRSYLALFVECALQLPEVEFDDVNGKEEVFDPEKHRELGRFMEPDDVESNSTCCIVFPSTLTARARVPPSDVARSGVIMWSSKYFKL